MVLTASEHQTIFLFKNKANFNMMTPASGKWQSNSSLDNRKCFLSTQQQVIKAKVNWSVKAI